MSRPTMAVPSKILLPGGECLIPVLARVLTRDEDNVVQEVEIIRPGIPIESVTGDQYVFLFVYERLVIR